MSKWLLEKPSPKTLAMREWLKTPAGEEYKEKSRERVRKWRQDNKERFHATQKRAYDKVRLDMLAHYSKGTPECACCKETGLPFLTLDHINGKGSEHRKQIEKEYGWKLGGNQLPYWLKKNNYPKGFQVLCANCNFAKRNKPQCPHQLSN